MALKTECSLYGMVHVNLNVQPTLVQRARTGKKLEQCHGNVF